MGKENEEEIEMKLADNLDEESQPHNFENFLFIYINYIFLTFISYI